VRYSDLQNDIGGSNPKM